MIKPHVPLWGFVVSTTFFAYVFEIESKCCASNTENNPCASYSILKEIIISIFDIWD